MTELKLKELQTEIARKLEKGAPFALDNKTTEKKTLYDNLSFKLNNSFNSEVLIPSRLPLYQLLNGIPLSDLSSNGFKNCFKNWLCPFQ